MTIVMALVGLGTLTGALLAAFLAGYTFGWMSATDRIPTIEEVEDDRR